MRRIVSVIVVKQEVPIFWRSHEVVVLFTRVRNSTIKGNNISPSTSLHCKEDIVRIRILFLIQSLGGGGAERVLVNLVNKMDRERFDITVETMFEGGVNQGLLNDGIRLIVKSAPLFKGVSTVYKLLPAGLLWRYYIGKESYDIVVAYRSGIPTKVLSGCPDPRVAKVTWIHYGDSRNSSYFTPWARVKDAFRAYASFDTVACVARDAASSFSSHTGIVDNVRVVRNTYDSERVKSRSSGRCDIPLAKSQKCMQLVTCGRLEMQKGYDRLLNVIARLVSESYSVHLLIAGEGSMRKALEAQTRELSLGDYVTLAGFLENPYTIMSKSDLFVCSSREEGMSTVVAESLILGVPVISTEVSGAKELLGDNDEYGLVVENSETGLYSGLKSLLDDKDLYERYRSAAVLRGSQLSDEATVGYTQELFESLMR